MKSSRLRVASDELVQLQTFKRSVPQKGYLWVKAMPLHAALGKAGGKQREPAWAPPALGSLLASPLVRREPRMRALTQQSAGPSSQLFLIERPSEPMASADDLDDALFREFAETPRTQEGVLSFANKHGWLGIPEEIIPATRRKRVHASPPQPTPVRLGEPINSWMTEIATMYRLVRLWDPSAHGRGASRRSEKFDQRIRWSADGEIFYEWEMEDRTGAELTASRSRKIRPWLLDILQPTRLKDILRWYLQIAANEKLAQHGVKVCLLRDSKSVRLRLNMVPTNLAGFLWLQFAKAIEGGTAYRQCEDCGKWFPLGGRSGRADKRFCSGSCKARSHRAKAKLAG